jgi:hypothetical protein
MAEEGYALGKKRSRSALGSDPERVAVRLDEASGFHTRPK